MGPIVTTNTSIEGVAVYPLKQIRDERGMVMHMMRRDSELFEGFGEVYFSVVKQSIVKAWKYHKRITQFFSVPRGEILLVIHDAREDSKTFGNTIEIESGIDKYGLVRLPPQVWYGFKGIGPGDSMIVNLTTEPHDPDESQQTDYHSSNINYQWND